MRRVLGPGLVGALAAATLLGFCGAWHWVLDLFAHFRVVYCLSLAALMAYSFWRKRAGLALTALVFAAVNAGTITPYLVRPAPAPVPPGATRVRLFHANLLVLNRDFEAVLSQLAHEGPDVIALAELTPAWFRALEPLQARYPYFVRNHIGDKFGLALWSKYPLTAKEAPYLGSAQRCSVFARVQLPGHELTILATHPWPPSKAAWARERDLQLQAVGERIAQEPGPKLVVGDLNATPWCHGFRLLLATSKLHDTERAGGIAYTWPEQLLVRIPIDHCLVSEGIQVLDRRVGQPTGSDHLPLILDLAVK